MEAKVINKEHNLLAAGYNEDGSYVHYYEVVDLGGQLKIIFDEDLYFPLSCEIEQLIEQTLNPYVNRNLTQSLLCCMSEEINLLLYRLHIDYMVFTEKEKFWVGDKYKKVWGVNKKIFDKA